MNRTGAMAPIRCLDEGNVGEALAAVGRADRDFGRALAVAGAPPLRVREPGFATLLRIMVGQQLSIHAAAAIWSRLEAAVSPLTPVRLLEFGDDELRALGFSRQKIAFARSLSEDVNSGRVDLDGLGTQDDETAIAELTTLKGVGRWTAEVYLLFALRRADVFPADDLALMTAVGRLKSLDARPTGKGLRDMAERWRPWRGAAAHFLWHYYRFDALG